jgi:hypothetical protein
MRKKGVSATVSFAAFLVFASGLHAGGSYKVLHGPDKLYLGHISYTEAKGDGKDPVVIRDGQVTAEVAVLNLPLAPGDTVRTPADRRCEVQFDTGTVIRLDFATELRIETINAQSLSASARLSNLALVRGRVYILYKEYDSREVFQLLTPVAALKMSHQTVATVRAASDGSTDVQVKHGKVNALIGRDEKSLEKQNLKAQERLIVLGPGQSQRASYIADSEFELWNNDINAHFVELHQDKSILPKPLQKLPDSVQYFAQTYGDVYGEWIWADLVGYVWRPYLDRMDYPSWRPYSAGSWTSVGGQLYWVPDEPWGWVPYHLGIWQWDKKLGWVWLPGSLFAPAWVDWAFYFGYYGWRPWSLYDWFGDFYLDAFYMGDAWSYTWPGFYKGYYPYTGGHLPNQPDPDLDNPGTMGIPQNTVRRSSPDLPMPGELKSAYKNVLAAYKKGDPRVIGSMRQLPAQASFVARADLNRSGVQGKAMSWDAIPKPTNVPGVKDPSAVTRTQPDARQTAPRAFRTNEAMQQLLHSAGVPGRVQKVADRPSAPLASAPRDGSGARPSPETTGGRPSEVPGPAGHPRFLDWNPDLKVARSLGVNIEYSSRRNEVRCPELHLTSTDRLRGADVGSVPTLGRQGISYESAGSAGVSGSSGSGGSGGPGGPGGASPGSGPGPSASGGGGAARGSGGEGSSGGSGGGKIKN